MGSKAERGCGYRAAIDHLFQRCLGDLGLRDAVVRTRLIEVGDEVSVTDELL